MVVVFLVRVAPLLPLPHREGEFLIQHGGKNIDKRDVGDDGPEQVRAHVSDRSHQQSARAASCCGKMLWRRVSGINEAFSAGDEVGEGVGLVHVLAVVVPPSPHLSTASYMRCGDYDSVLQQRHLVGPKTDVHADSIGPVPHKQDMRWAMIEGAFSKNQRNRDICAIWRCRMNSRRLEIRPVVAEDFGLFFQLSRSIVHIVVEHRMRRNPGRILVTQRIRLELSVIPQPDIVHWLLDLDLTLVSCHAANCDDRETANPLANGEKVCKGVDTGDHHVVVVRYDFSPVLGGRVGHRRAH